MADSSYINKVVWDKVTNFKLICTKYVTYVQKHFGTNICIVFDGYTNDKSISGTKSAERERRIRKKQSPDVVFDENTTPTISQDKFLSNANNKERFIAMIRVHFELAGIDVRQAVEDAD
ncbi:hypothetical protein DD595_25480, partial [Enterobacter cloacae complex sp. 4DZ3-17B2]|uniref:hypothetical protein n=1 Tax=Enterobacter cloacae complex sp. 4DZ3-17B2 TaxID=2511990 RepID=UPI0010271C5A